MKLNRFNQAIFAAVFLMGTVQAKADVVWDWGFVTNDVQVSPTGNIYGRATVTNSASSTGNLSFNGAGAWAVFRNGDYNWEYRTNFGRDEEFPWPKADAEILNLSIAPGETRSFDLAWFTPAYGSVSNGSYSVAIDLSTGSSSTTTIERELTWQVSAVPEPSSYALMLAGIGLLGTIARRRKNK